MESPPDSSTVKTRVLILSDTHNKKPFSASDTQHAYRSPLPEADLLLHAGDLTVCGRPNEHRAQMEMLTAHPAELKIVVPGNHDITLDKPYYHEHEWKHGVPEDLALIEEIYTGPAAQQAGVVLIKEGVQSFTLQNGARFTVYASAYQPEFCDWAFAYNRNEDRFNPVPAVQRLLGYGPANPIPSHPEIDIVVTHGPPYGVLDKVKGMSRGMNSSVGCQHLLRAARRCKPRLHAFGHIHEGWGAERVKWPPLTNPEAKDESRSIEVDKDAVMRERAAFLDVSSTGDQPLQWGQETLFVNASIMDVRYNPRNAPWVIDLDLPKA